MPPTGVGSATRDRRDSVGGVFANSGSSSLTPGATIVNRRTTSSRPSTSSASNNGGPTVRPVTATRIGACALPFFSPCRSPIASSVSFSAAASHCGSCAIRLGRLQPAPPWRPASTSSSSHAASSSTGSARNTKSMTPGTSDNVVARDCTTGAIAANLAGSKRSAGHGTSSDVEERLAGGDEVVDRQHADVLAVERGRAS